MADPKKDSTAAGAENKSKPNKLGPPAEALMALTCSRCGSRVTQVHGGMVRPRNCPIPKDCTFKKGVLYARPTITLDPVKKIKT